MKRLLYFVILPVSVLIFFWSYQTSGQLLKSFQHAMATAAFLMGLLRLYQLRQDKKNSGLAEDEYILKQAGSATSLMSQSITVRAIGWLCVVLPIVLVLITFMATKSLQLTVIISIVLSVFCVPGAIWLFRIAARGRRVAEAAGAKLW